MVLNASSIGVLLALARRIGLGALATFSGRPGEVGDSLMTVLLMLAGIISCFAGAVNVASVASVKCYNSREVVDILSALADLGTLLSFAVLAYGWLFRVIKKKSRKETEHRFSFIA